MGKRCLIVISSKSHEDFVQLVRSQDPNACQRHWAACADDAADCWYADCEQTANRILDDHFHLYESTYIARHPVQESLDDFYAFHTRDYSHISSDSLWNPHLQGLVRQLLRLSRSDKLDERATTAVLAVCTAVLDRPGKFRMRAIEVLCTLMSQSNSEWCWWECRRLIEELVDDMRKLLVRDDDVENVKSWIRERLESSQSGTKAGDSDRVAQIARLRDMLLGGDDGTVGALQHMLADSGS